MSDLDVLAPIMAQRFAGLTIRTNYGWPGNTALCVLECVLSLNRRYDRMVRPRIERFAERHPEVVHLRDLERLLETYKEVGEFSISELAY